MKQSLDGILARESVEIPVYDFKTHSRCSEYRVVSAADVVLLEGILVLYDPTVRALMNMKLFVDTDSDTRLSRRGIVIKVLFSPILSPPPRPNILSEGQ